MEQLTPIVQKVVQDLLSSNDVTHQEAVTSHITEGIRRLVDRNVAERNKILKQQKEASLNQLVQSMINDMWSIVSDTIRNSIDTSNIDKDKYDQMVKRVIPEIIQTVESSAVKKVLSYPVVEDELQIIIRSNNLSYSVNDLTDKMFRRLVCKISLFQSYFS